MTVRDWSKKSLFVIKGKTLDGRVMGTVIRICTVTMLSGLLTLVFQAPSTPPLRNQLFAN